MPEPAAGGPAKKTPGPCEPKARRLTLISRRQVAARLDEIELLQRCKRQDLAAFEALYQLYHQRALRTAYLLTRSRPAAEDAVQETFIQVWRGIAGLREVGAFRAWLYRILLATVHRLARKGRGVVVLSLDLQAHDAPDRNAPVPDEYIEYEAELRELRRAIASLPDADQRRGHPP